MATEDSALGDRAALVSSFQLLVLFLMNKSIILSQSFVETNSGQVRKGSGVTTQTHYDGGGGGGGGYGGGGPGINSVENESDNDEKTNGGNGGAGMCAAAIVCLCFDGPFPCRYFLL